MEAFGGKSTNNDSKTTSVEDFQNKLCVWFEEKGVLAELRTHLRHQMIETLKTSQFGRRTSFERKQNANLSPKYQAINLVVAEYLMTQGYQYSVSVFSSEVGTLHALHTQVKQDQSVGFRGKVLWDILEALGVPLESEVVHRVSSLYEQQGDGRDYNSLLTCLLRVLASQATGVSSNVKVVKEQEPTPSIKTPVIVKRDTEVQCDGGGLQPSLDVEDIIHQVHASMQQAFDHEVGVVREEERQRYELMARGRETEIQRLLEEERGKHRRREGRIREELERERDSMREMYEKKEAELQRGMAREMELERYKILSEYRDMVQSKSGESKEILLRKALERVEEQSNRLREKEQLLETRIREMQHIKRVEEKEEQLEKKHTSTEDINSLKEKEELLDQRLKEIEGIKDLREKMQGIQDLRERMEGIIRGRSYAHREVQTDLGRVSREAQTDGEIQDVKSSEVDGVVIEELRRENDNLKMLTQQQSTQIEKLNDKQLNMAREIHQAHTQVQQLSSRLSSGVRGSSLERKKKSSSSRRHSTKRREYVSSSDDDRTSKDNSSVRKQKGSTTEDNSIDDVLRDAKRRLKMLELESEAVDRSYQRFKLKQDLERHKVEDRKSTITATTTYQHNTTKTGKVDTVCDKPNIDTIVPSKPTSPTYNTFRRVLQPAMDVDRTVLHKYISESNLRIGRGRRTEKEGIFLGMNRVSNEGTLIGTNRVNKEGALLGTNRSRFAGTTDFLLKRIENCTQNVRKYNPNDYSQYLGKSRLQHNIRPSVSWKNVRNMQLDSELEGDSSKEIQPNIKQVDVMISPTRKHPNIRSNTTNHENFKNTAAVTINATATIQEILDKMPSVSGIMNKISVYPETVKNASNGSGILHKISTLPKPVVADNQQVTQKVENMQKTSDVPQKSNIEKTLDNKPIVPTMLIAKDNTSFVHGNDRIISHVETSDCMALSSSPQSAKIVVKFDPLIDKVINTSSNVPKIQHLEDVPSVSIPKPIQGISSASDKLKNVELKENVLIIPKTDDPSNELKYVDDSKIETVLKTNIVTDDPKSVDFSEKSSSDSSSELNTISKPKTVELLKNLSATDNEARSINISGDIPVSRNTIPIGKPLEVLESKPTTTRNNIETNIPKDVEKSDPIATIPVLEPKISILRNKPYKTEEKMVTDIPDFRSVGDILNNKMNANVKNVVPEVDLSANKADLNISNSQSGSKDIVREREPNIQDFLDVSKIVSNISNDEILGKESTIPIINISTDKSILSNKNSENITPNLIQQPVSEFQDNKNSDHGSKMNITKPMSNISEEAPNITNVDVFNDKFLSTEPSEIQDEALDSSSNVLDKKPMDDIPSVSIQEPTNNIVNEKSNIPPVIQDSESSKAVPVKDISVNDSSDSISASAISKASSISIPKEEDDDMFWT